MRCGREPSHRRRFGSLAFVPPPAFARSPSGALRRAGVHDATPGAVRCRKGSKCVRTAVPIHTAAAIAKLTIRPGPGKLAYMRHAPGPLRPAPERNRRAQADRASLRSRAPLSIRMARENSSVVCCAWFLLRGTERIVAPAGRRRGGEAQHDGSFVFRLTGGGNRCGRAVVLARQSCYGHRIGRRLSRREWLVTDSFARSVMYRILTAKRCQVTLQVHNARVAIR